jgi:membrane peptidoglycan carboxypeptidase
VEADVANSLPPSDDEAPGQALPASGRAKKPRSRRNKVGRAVLFSFLLLVVAGAASLVIGYVITPVPDPNKLVTANATIIYYADGKTQMGAFAAQNRTTVPLTEVSKAAQDATIAAENRTFWTDHGVSITGMIRAAWHDIRGDSTQGASTITQQYVKNYYLTQEQTWSRKIRELFITLKVQRQMSKQQILAGYLNTVYYGRGAYGIESAAHTYFGVSAAHLDAEQSAVLASLLKAPSRYDPAVGTASKNRLVDRYHYVLSGMAELGDYPQAKAARATLPHIRSAAVQEQFAGPTGYLLAAVRRELLGAGGMTEQEITAGGLRVVTTVDKKAQAAAEKAVDDNRPTVDAAGVHIGLAAVEPGTGEVVAAYGGKDYLKRAFSDATQAKFQPGSSFKAFTLAAMLSDKMSLKSRFDGNSPLNLPGGGVVNNDGHESYGSSVDMLTATAKSINTAFVDLTETIGPQRVVDAAIAAGIPKDPKDLLPVPVVTLGVASETPLTMANAYGTFAAQGERSTPHFVREVTSRGGRTVYKPDDKPTRVFDTDVTADVTYALQQVVQRGTGVKAQSVGRPVAGKTGTHENQTAWFVGFTPQLVAAVGTYREDAKGRRQPLDGVDGRSAIFGADYPLDIWAEFMKAAMAGKKVLTFPEPAFVGEANVATTAPSTEKPATHTPQASPSPTEAATPTPTPEPTGGPSPTAKPTDNPQPTPTVKPTSEPPPSPTPKPTPKPKKGLLAPPAELTRWPGD